MAIEVFNRYENKYLLDHEAYLRFYSDLLDYMELDDYNKQHEFYSISNLYFDTPHHSLIRTSLSKPKYKEKLRLRAYGVTSGDAKVYLEMKKKVFGLVNKRRTGLKLSEAYEFVRTGSKPELQPYMNKQVLEEIHYFLSRYELEPKVYLAYERKAMFSKASRDLRITFDTNIRHRRHDLGLELGDHGELLDPSNKWLMEVKAENTVPLWLSRLLSEHGLFRTSFSKYGNEYKKTVRHGHARPSLLEQTMSAAQTTTPTPFMERERVLYV
ncbi:polyphosphate polymerase domain-containing protein [Paenibacillus soyae]|uniref:Polyphosphate polymerase domain-containing protein n=1 Tax=Paenibacillus soyae TaxID=2969249 RepID=A0A9X2MV99_9BACL|nr:polyphosphate polymerase domain-containing protein [Paenibacillus soyae]MCR2806972.1 polyphosphate polymerase domain-containing protein [Paenibacillus soyae]